MSLDLRSLAWLLDFTMMTPKEILFTEGLEFIFSTISETLSGGKTVASFPSQAKSSHYSSFLLYEVSHYVHRNLTYLSYAVL